LTPIRRQLAKLLYLLVFCALPALAAPAPVPTLPAEKTAVKDSEVRFLYPAGQIYKQDKVFPLVVEISNLTGLPKSYKASWSLNLELPPQLKSIKLEPGEKRRFPLNFPRNEVGGASTIELNGKSYSSELQPCPRNSTTGLLSPATEKFDYLRTLKLEVDPTVATASEQEAKPSLVPLAALAILDPELVPEGWPMLSCLDVIIAYDLPSMALSKLQKAALVSWVCQGGRLVLVSDGLPEEFQGTPFQEHLPLQPTGVVTDQGLVQLVGEVAPGAETLMTYHDRPLLLRKPLMRGELFLVTAPLKEQAPLTVEEAETLWKQVLPDQVQDPNGTGSYNYGYNYNYYPSITANTLRNIPELPRAGPGWVALFLLVYALIVGPVNLGILRRKDKMLWSFVTVPVIALVFAGGAYLLNSSSRSSVPVLRELGVLQVKSGDARGYAVSEALFFSPSSDRYLIDCEPDAICHPATYSYENPPFAMYESLANGGLQASIAMGTWDVFMLNTESLIELPSPLKGSWKNGTLTVDSPLSTAANEAQVYSPEKGASEVFQLKGGQQTETLELKDPASYTKFEKLGDPPDKQAHPSRADLLSNISNQSATVFEAKKTYLMFWTDKLVAPLNPKAPGLHRAEYLVVLELELEG
jgi:hypothetical protein